MADALNAVMGTDELGENAIQVVPRLNFNPQAPTSIDIYPATPFREDDTAGMGDLAGAMIFTVRARATIGDNDGAQEQLLALMDDENALCVAAALESDPTLGGTVDQITVDLHNGFQVFSDPPGEMLVCSWRAKVIP